MSPSLLIILTASVGAPAIKESPKEPPSIVGEWVVEKALVEGKDSVITPGSVWFVFTADGRVRVREGNKDPGPADYKLDSKKSPAEIDIMPPAALKELAMKGIYKVEGEGLTICMSRRETRPTKFESPDGSDLMLMTMKRVMKKNDGE